MFTVEDVPVEIFTYSHQQQDLVSFRIISSLLKEKRLAVTIRFPYPNGEFKDAGVNRSDPGKHNTVFVNGTNGGSIKHTLDSTTYYVTMQWKGNAGVTQKQKHEFEIKPITDHVFELSCAFTSRQSKKTLPTFDELRRTANRNGCVSGKVVVPLTLRAARIQKHLNWKEGSSFHNTLLKYNAPVIIRRRKPASPTTAGMENHTLKCIGGMRFILHCGGGLN
jgi:hypothetical protein